MNHEPYKKQLQTMNLFEQQANEFTPRHIGPNEQDRC
jgi:hypothetical protein